MKQQRPHTHLSTMRVALAVSFYGLAFALRPAPIARLLAPVSSNAKLPSNRNSFSTSSSSRTPSSVPCTTMMASGPSNDEGDREQSEGPFTRKSLLEGVTKTAGVLGAGTFVQKGFFAGVPYNGKPDLSGKVS